MTYIPIVLSVCSILLSAYIFVSKNNKENTSELTTVIVKLENIGNGISDIKKEIASIKDDQKEDHDKLIVLETSLSSLWKQFNNNINKE